jgi:hypothetical protein
MVEVEELPARQAQLVLLGSAQLERQDRELKVARVQLEWELKVAREPRV